MESPLQAARDYIVAATRWVTETAELFKAQLTPRLVKELHELDALGISDPTARAMADGNISLNDMLTLAERVNGLGRQLLDHLARNLSPEST